MSSTCSASTRSRNCSSTTATRAPESRSRNATCSGEDVLYIENGRAPRCIAAASTRWNSGRLVSISASVSPRRSPRAWRPPAMRRTRSAYSRQVISSAPFFVRRATASGWASAVLWKASQTVRADISGAYDDGPPGGGPSVLRGIVRRRAARRRPVGPARYLRLLDEAARGGRVDLRDAAGELGLRVCEVRDPLDLARVGDLVLVVGDGLERGLVGVEHRSARLAAEVEDLLVDVAQAVGGGVGLVGGLGVGGGGGHVGSPLWISLLLAG